jgi:type I restriction enzyme M protein
LAWLAGQKCSGPAAVGFDDFVDLGHEADGFFQGDDDLLVVGDVIVGKRPATAEYKHVVLGLIFLKYISDAFQERYNALKAEKFAGPEDRNEYAAENVFWVPKAARWLPLMIP